MEGEGEGQGRAWILTSVLPPHLMVRACLLALNSSLITIAIAIKSCGEVWDQTRGQGKRTSWRQETPWQVQAPGSRPCLSSCHKRELEGVMVETLPLPFLPPLLPSSPIVSTMSSSTCITLQPPWLVVDNRIERWRLRHLGPRLSLI